MAVRGQQRAAMGVVIVGLTIALAAYTAAAFAVTPLRSVAVPGSGVASGGNPALAAGVHQRPHITASKHASLYGYARGTLAALVALGATALIVQNKGGGHGEIGYHLALNLVSKGLKVKMINDSAAKKDKPPFNSYADLASAGVDVTWVDLEGGGVTSAIKSMPPADYVFDNQNVCTKDVQQAVAAWNPKAYAYVSSGGMYKPVPEGPLLETGKVKEDNKQLSLERSAAAAGLAWSAYRPQYIYGPKTAKRDYLDWFFDRVTRGLPIPLPVDGHLRTTLTHAADVAGMMASVVGKEAEAKGQVFNCATDVRVSHREIVFMVAKATGRDPDEVMKTIVCYDPAALKGVDLPKKGKFPFRETNFGVGVAKAKEVLGWRSAHKLQDDLSSYYEEYMRLGLSTKPVVRDWDEAVLAKVMA